MHNEHQVAITLLVTNADGVERRETVAREIIKLGRGKASHVRLNDESVSRMHAVIEVQGEDEVTLIDLGNGTSVNGARVNKCKLHVGDEITLGSASLKIEEIALGIESRVADAQPLAPQALNNPFTSAPFKSPFSTRALRGIESAVADDAPEGSYEYALVKAGPDVPSTDVETHADGVAVTVSWGSNILAVSHIDADASYWLGEVEDKALRCDYFVPREKLGCGRAPLVIAGRAVLIPGCTGTVTVPGKPAMPISDAIAGGMATPCAEIAGGHEIPLTNGTTVRMQVEDMIFEVRGEKKGRKAATAFTVAAIMGGAMAYVLGSFVGHAGLLAAVAMFMPPMGDTYDEDITEEQRIFLMQATEDLAHKEKEETPDESLHELNDGNVGSDGIRAKNEEGTMGDPTTDKTNGRWAAYGPRDNVDPHIASARALEDARTFGVIGMINAGMGGDPSAPIADWGRIDTLGNDPLSANGNMWADQIGDANGAGGLGLTGIGEGGGGRGEGIGLSSIGTINHGAGGTGKYGLGGGHGNSWGRIGAHHGSRPPRMRPAGDTTVSGRLPPEVIQRVVRQNYGRFRLCYESALRTNPNLQGRVVINFIIGRDGTVRNTSGGGDLPNGGVISCMASAAMGLTFPQPDGGVVRVTYPFALAPAGG